MIHFRSHADLIRDTLALLPKLPVRSIRAVVGMPRSGMLPATILAEAMNVPLFDFLGHENNPWLGLALPGPSKGRRGGAFGRDGEGQTVLFVDDTVYRGQTMRRARNDVAERKAWRRFDPLFAAVYIAPQTCNEAAGSMPDVWGSIVPTPRYFSWNVLHHPDNASMAFDLDGVLCADPTEREDDTDRPAYRAFVRTARLLYRPTFPLGAIVTNRLRVWRKETQRWLRRSGVKHGDLIMSPFDTAKGRRSGETYGTWKGLVYTGLRDCNLFVESDESQAAIIAEVSGKPVLSLETWNVHQSTIDAPGIAPVH